MVCTYGKQQPYHAGEWVSPLVSCVPTNHEKGMPFNSPAPWLTKMVLSLAESQDVHSDNQTTSGGVQVLPQPPVSNSPMARIPERQDHVNWLGGEKDLVIGAEADGFFQPSTT